jgi:hypothetical protein
MRRVLPPSEPPDGERPHCLCLVVEGAQPRGGWYLSAIVRLQGFSSGSPAASPHRWSPKTVTTSLMVGRSKPGCGLCPALSFKDLRHPCWGGGRGEPGPALAWAGVPLLPPASRGGNHPPALRRRRPPAMSGKANCCCAQPGCSIPSSVRATVASRTGGSHNTSYAARAVLVFWDGPILVFVVRTRVRTCRCALGRPAPAGAALVGRSTPPSVLRWWQLEKASPSTRPPTPPAPLDLRLPGLNGWFSSFVGEGFFAAAFALKPLLQLSCRPGQRSLSLL